MSRDTEVVFTVAAGEAVAVQLDNSDAGWRYAICLPIRSISDLLPDRFPSGEQPPPSHDPASAGEGGGPSR